MKRLLLWLATIILVVYSIAAITYRFLSPDANRAAAESYAVYSAYLAQATGLQKGASGADEAAPTVLLDHTTCPFRICISPSMKGASRFLRGQLAIENLRPTPLDPHFDPSLHVALAPSTNPVLFQQPELSRSYGQITFSAVSFNRSLTRALFYTERLCGLCGGAHFVLMHKVGHVWTVEREVSNWIS